MATTWQRLTSRYWCTDRVGYLCSCYGLAPQHAERCAVGGMGKASGDKGAMVLKLCWPILSDFLGKCWLRGDRAGDGCVWDPNSRFFIPITKPTILIENLRSILKCIIFLSDDFFSQSLPSLWVKNII